VVAVKRALQPVLGRSPTLKRRFQPMDLAKELSSVYPAIIPVLHLGPKLMADKLPRWRRQTFPEDVWLKEKVDGKPLTEKVDVVSESGEKRSELTLVKERVQAYFEGDKKGGKTIYRDGRRWSKMLGFLAVDIVADARHVDKICFSDRFSEAGKVIFALLVAYAFGGRDGKKITKKPPPNSTAVAPVKATDFQICLWRSGYTTNTRTTKRQRSSLVFITGNTPIFTPFLGLPRKMVK